MKIFKQAMPYIIILLSVILIRTFIATPVVVSGPSMDDTLHDGQLLLLNKMDKSIERYDIIVFKYNNSKLVKRVIGLPGEHVKYQDGILYVNGVEVSDLYADKTNNFQLENLGYDVIPDDYYFVLGDNRMRSSDSRIIGLIKKDDIVGKALFSIWPLGKVEKR